ncbi:MAG: sigma-70 family RNA polymerase sigma factor [Solirubrobacteraceae bacterium]
MGDRDHSAGSATSFAQSARIHRLFNAARRRRGARSGTADRLAAAAERQLVIAAKHGGDAERAAFVQVCTPLIASLASMYHGRKEIDGDELMQEGVVGLLRALERFDPELGAPFWMYASWWVRQAMQRLVAELGGPIVLSDSALRKLARINDARTEILQRERRESRTADVARITGISPTQVDSLLAADRHPRALEEPVRNDGQAGATFEEMLHDPSASEAFERIPSRIDADELPRRLCVLDERERTIIRARFGLGRPERTRLELGEKLGLTAERIRQIEVESLRKLRHAL